MKSKNESNGSFLDAWGDEGGDMGESIRGEAEVGGLGKEVSIRSSGVLKTRDGGGVSKRSKSISAETCKIYCLVARGHKAHCYGGTG